MVSKFQQVNTLRCLVLLPVVDSKLHGIVFLLLRLWGNTHYDKCDKLLYLTIAQMLRPHAIICVSLRHFGHISLRRPVINLNDRSGFLEC